MKTTSFSTLSEYAEHQAYNSPGQIISTFNDEINIYTIKELNKKANLLAKGLMYQGVANGSRVAMVLSKTTSCMTFILALAKIGAVMIPMKQDWEQRKTESVLKEENVHTLGFYADTFIKPFKKMLPNYADNERGYLNSSMFPALKNIITFGSIKNRGMFTTRELMLLGSHMDDIEMEYALQESQPEDTFIELIRFNGKQKTKQKISHQNLLDLELSLPEILIHLLEIVE